MDISAATKYNPDEIVTITNNKTKQVKQVRRKQLSEYGLPPDYISQADTFAGSIKAGITTPDQVPTDYRAGAMQALNTQGFTPKSKIETEVDAQKIKARPDAEAVYSGIENLKKQAQDATITESMASFVTGGNLGTDAAIFDQSKKLLGQTIANLFEKGRLSDKDRDFYQNEIMNVGSVGEQGAIEKKLDNLSREILRKAGYKPEDFQKKGEQKKTEPSFVDNVVSNAQRLPGQFLDIGKAILDTNNPIDPIGNVQRQADLMTGFAGSTAQMTSDVAQDPVGWAYKNPVDAAMTVAPVPFLKGAKAGKIKPGLSVEEAVATTPNLAEKTIRRGVDAVSGAGSKDYVARQATRTGGGLPQNQALLDEGILAHPTDTGRIQATKQALSKTGDEIGNVYKNSDRVYRGDKLRQLLDNGLRDQGYSQRDIDFIKRYLSEQGSFDLNSGDSLITLDGAWTAARKLENNPPKILKGAEYSAGYKQLAKDAARVIRQDLAEKLPEVKPLNDKYSAFRDYYDEKLPDKARGALDVNGNPIKTVANIAQRGTEAVAQGAYKLLGNQRTKTGSAQLRQPPGTSKKK